MLPISEQFAANIITAVVVVSVFIMIYKALYTSFVNRKLKEKSYNYEVRMGRVPDPNNIIKVIVIFIIIGTIGSMRDEIEDISSKLTYVDDDGDEIAMQNVGGRLEVIEEEIGGISSRIKKMEKNNSMISSVDAYLGELNPDNHNVKVTFSVIPANYNVNAKHYLLIGKDKKEVELKNVKNGVLEGSIELNSLKPHKNITFVEEANGSVKSEKVYPQDDWEDDILSVMGWYEDSYGTRVDDEYNVIHKYLLDVCHSDHDGTSESIDEDEAEVDFKFTIEAFKPEIVDGDKVVAEAKVIVESDGDKVEEIPVDVEQLNKKEKTIFEYKNKLIGKNIKIYSEIKDKYGFRYIDMLWVKKGNESNYDDYDDDTTRIYDKNNEEIEVE